MDNIKLVKPSIKHEKMYFNALKSWSMIETIPTSPRAFFEGKDMVYNDFLELLKNDELGVGNYVPSTLYFLIKNDTEIIGSLHLRHNLENEDLKNYGGHIGYGIHPNYRNKGYGKLQLQLGLIEAKKLGINKVMIGCYSDNIGSKKIIESCLGIFERTFILNGNTCLIYNIINK